MEMTKQELEKYNDNTEYVKILSDEQMKFYMLNNVIPVKTYFSEYEDSSNRIVYVFKRKETSQVYKLWKLASGWK